MKRIIIALSGASGAPYAAHLCQTLGKIDDIEPHLLLTHTASSILKQECGIECPADQPYTDLFGSGAKRAKVHSIHNLYAPIASGSFAFDALVVIPCSMGRVGAFRAGIVRDLLDRVAEVALKERRTFIIVPREAPLSLIHLENLTELTRAGATIMPASPGFYHSTPQNPATVQDLITFMTSRIMDQLGLPHSFPSWGK